MVADKVLALCQSDGSLQEDLAKISGMFSDHFQNIFSPYSLIYTMVADRNACHKVVPHKV